MNPVIRALFSSLIDFVTRLRIGIPIWILLPAVAVILPACDQYHSFDFILPPGSSLRTDGVYLIQTFYPDDEGEPDTARPVYAFVRFFSDGRCFYSNARDGYASTRDFASLSEDAGEQTFYKMTEDTVVVQLHSGGRFTHWVFHLQTDSLLIIAETKWGLLNRLLDLQPRRIEACMSKPKYYVFRPVELMTRPDW